VTNRGNIIKPDSAVSIVDALYGYSTKINEDGQLHVVLAGTVDTNNSTSTPLPADTGGIDHIFTGSATNILDHGFIFVTTYSDVGSATDGLSVHQSTDGTNWDNTDEYTVPAAKGKTYSFQPGTKYFRVIYTNGVIAQTVFRLQTVLKKTSSLASSHRIQDSIVDEDDAELVKAVITGQSDINDIFENAKTYRGALQVDAALVHKIGVSEHARTDLDGSTTLDIAASIGDVLINVASTTNFAVGSIITVEGERSHFHVIVVNAGVSLTLNRPIDNDHNPGVVVQEVSIAMNVVGSLGSPISYKIQPPSTERWQLTRIMTTILDQSAMDDATFGGIGALTNGVVIRFYVGGIYQTITHWQSNGDLKDDMYDVEYSDKAPAGYFGLNGRWTFTKAEFIADLDGTINDYLEVLIQDDLSNLDDFELKAQGRLFGG